MLGFITWNPDPVIFSIGSLSVRWYGLLYAIGFFVAITIIDRCFKHDKAPSDWTDKVFIYMVLATIIGARLGHVFFYDWAYYREHLSEIPKVWHGGLASHGGAIALFLTAWLMSKYMTKQSIFWLADRVYVGSAFVAILIRLGNLMNSEIYGCPTDLPWGFRFVRDAAWYTEYNQLPCHPTQLYESFAYLIVFLLLMWLYWKKDGGQYKGLLTGVGTLGIFLARFIIEHWKNVQEPWEKDMFINMGQVLSIPFIILGITLIIYALKVGKVEWQLPKEKVKPAKK